MNSRFQRRLFRLALATSLLAFGSAASAAVVASSDQDWINKAARAGMAEVAAGNLAATAGQRQDVKQFGTQMAKDHGAANDELKSIASKKGASVPEGPDKAHQKEMAKLQKLSGTKFDKEYLKSAGVKDHSDAVSLFKKGAKDLKDPDLKAFAQRTLPTVEQHYDMAKGMSKL